MLRQSGGRRRGPRPVHHGRRPLAATAVQRQQGRVAEVDRPPVRQLLEKAVGAVRAAAPPARNMLPRRSAVSCSRDALPTASRAALVRARVSLDCGRRSGPSSMTRTGLLYGGRYMAVICSLCDNEIHAAEGLNSTDGSKGWRKSQLHQNSRIPARHDCLSCQGGVQTCRCWPSLSWTWDRQADPAKQARR